MADGASDRRGPSSVLRLILVPPDKRLRVGRVRGGPGPAPLLD